MRPRSAHGALNTASGSPGREDGYGQIRRGSRIDGMRRPNGIWRVSCQDCNWTTSGSSEGEVMNRASEHSQATPARHTAFSLSDPHHVTQVRLVP